MSAFAGLLVALAHAGSVQAQAPRFNIISIVTDDQAAWTLGCYGNKESITPHMDRLAREGARFANAFTVTPVCSPSRVTFMTGKYGAQLGITDWIAPNEAKAGLGLKAGVVTWPKVLQGAGYQTALIGKWHLGDQAASHPNQQGFHHFYGFLGGGTSPMNPTYDFPDGPKVVQGYGADLLTDEAVRWLEENKERTFALSLHFREPHTAYAPVPEQDSKPFATLDPTVPESKGADVGQLKQWTREYYAAIHSVDRNLGRLFAWLEKAGLWDRTIIQFTSDHGYNIGHHGIHTKGNGMWVAGGVTGPKRANMWDTSLRIPLLVRWPGVVKPGTVIQQQVLNLDTWPSMLDFAGATAPKKWKVEGQSYASLLRGENAPWRTEWLGQYDLHNGGLAYMRMVRTEEWKYVRHFHANLMDELYNLKDDPEETRNLLGGAGRRKMNDRVDAVVRELLEKMESAMKAIKDPVLKEPRRRGWFEDGELHD